MKNLTLMGLLLLSFDSHSQAVCDSFIRNANYNQFENTTESEKQILNMANFCSEEYNNASAGQKANIEMAYKGFGLSGGNSSSDITEYQKKECKGIYGQSRYHNFGLLRQKLVSDTAADTFARCIESFKGGLQFEPTFTSDQSAVHVKMKWTNRDKLDFRGIIKSPSKGVKCSLDKTDTENPELFKNRKISAGESITFNCERALITEVIDGESVSCYPETLISVDTAQYPFTIPMYKQCNKSYLITRAESLEKKIADLRIQLEAINPKINTFFQKTLNLDHTPSNRRPCTSIEEVLTNEPGAICFLTGVEGKFEGNGETLRVFKAVNDSWIFKGSSCQPGVKAEVACARANK